MTKFIHILTAFFSLGLMLARPMAIIPVSAGNSADPTTETSQLIGSVDKFSATVVNGNARQIVGIYVEDTFASPIVQQPNGNAAYVSTQDNIVTQFSTASQYGSIGLVAHNNLAGEKFSDLKVGDRAVLVYGDGTKLTYEITEIDAYQALSPNSPYSNFVDVNHTDVTLSVSDMFMKIYNPDDRLILQTCIAKEGVESWGRLFVVAERVEDLPLNY
ncbi:MAG: sortase [Anaerolineaceae bacterium]|nr:sortase [Anaerolineaceae bacterium]